MAGRDQVTVDNVCRDLYRVTRDFWAEINLSPRFGFKILNGPPIKNAEILFIGYQPGGGEKAANCEKEKGTDVGWPERCEYATETWPLAPRMRRVFGVERLTSCVGTNAVFLRYPNANYYRRDVGSKRTSIENFCRNMIFTMIEAIQPKHIVTIGFAALEMFGPTSLVFKRDRNENALIKSGAVAGRPALGIIHLTGARPSACELDIMASHFKSA